MNWVMTTVGRSLLKSADSLVISIAIASWQFLTRTPLTSRTLATLLGIYAVLNVADFLRKTCDDAPAVGTTPEKETKRIFVDHPEVVLELAKLSGYEALRQFTPYLGKWMTISGRYEGSAESLQRDSVHLSLLWNDGRRINLRFAIDHAEKFHELREGQRITAICQIQYGVFFKPENCELVRTEPLPRAERPTLAYAS